MTFSRGTLRRSLDLIGRRPRIFPTEAPLFAFADGTFARASAATWWDGSILTRYGTGVLRQPTTINGRKAYAFEGARTNYLKNSNDLDGAAWSLVGSATLSANEAGDPSGGSQADAIIHTASAGDAVQQTPVGFPTSVNAYLSRFVKQKAAFTDDTIQLRFIDHGGSTLNDNIESSLVWQRHLLDGSDSGTPDAGSMRYRHRNAFAETRDLYVFGSQLEEGLFASSLIETTGAAATRVADDLTMTPPDTVPFVGGFWFQWQPSYSSVEHIAQGGSRFLVAPHASRYVRVQTGVAKLRVGGDVTSGLTPLLSWSAGQVLTIVVDWVAGELRCGGFTSGDGTTDISSFGDWSSDTTLQIGNAPALNAPEYGLLTELYPLASAPI